MLNFLISHVEFQELCGSLHGKNEIKVEEVMHHFGLLK